MLITLSINAIRAQLFLNLYPQLPSAPTPSKWNFKYTPLLVYYTHVIIDNPSRFVDETPCHGVLFVP